MNWIELMAQLPVAGAVLYIWVVSNRDRRNEAERWEKVMENRQKEWRQDIQEQNKNWRDFIASQNAEWRKTINEIKKNG